MNSTGKTIAKNASVLMVSQMITWGLSFILTIMVPRYLGVEAIGQMRLGTSIWAIVAIVSVFGMDTLITKEVARTPERTSELFGTTLILRMVFFVLGGLAALIYVKLIGYSPITGTVIIITGISAAVSQFSGAFDASLKGLERMEYTSLANIATILTLVILRVGLLLIGQGVIAIVAAGIAANAVGVIVQYYFLNKFHRLRLTINKVLAREMTQKSAPYFFVNVVIVLYHQVDVIVLSWLLSEKSIGWYSVADQLLGTFLFISTISMTALFPALTRMYASSSDSFARLARKSIDMITIVAVPIGLGVFVVSNQLVVLLYGDAFAKSGPILAIRGIVLILTYLNTSLGLLLISMDKQKVWARVIAVAMVVTLPLDIVLIPWCQRMFNNGAIGGAISYFCTDGGMLIAALLLLPKGILGKSNLWLAARVVFAGLAMVAASWGFRNDFLAIPVIIGAATYIGLILLLRVITPEDWAIIGQIRTAIMQRLRDRLAGLSATKG